MLEVLKHSALNSDGQKYAGGMCSHGERILLNLCCFWEERMRIEERKTPEFRARG